MMAEMMNGDKVSFGTNDGTTVTVGAANVTQADVAASNGIIHVIDKVLMPPTDIPTTASGTGIHNTLVNAVVDAGYLLWKVKDHSLSLHLPTKHFLGVDLL